MATTSPYIHTDFLFHCALPSLKFQIPNSTTQENQETILSPSLSNRHIRLYCNTTHHVLNAIDPDFDFQVTEPHYQSRVYLHNPLQQGLVNVLSNWQIPETYHEYIISSTLFQLATVEQYYNPQLPTPFLFQVDVSCDKYYRPSMDIFLQYSREATYQDDDNFQENLTDDENSEYDDDYWMPQYNADDEIDAGMIPTSESAIKSLVVRERGMKLKDQESCPICLEEFLEGSVKGCMPCSHMFHEECITNWLRKSHYCPLCRLKMPTTMSK